MPKGSRSRTPAKKTTPKKSAGASKGRKATPTGKSRSRTPASKKSGVKAASGNKRSASNTPVKSKSTAKVDNQRKFYTVKEDFTIFKAWKDGSKKNKTVSDISKTLANDLSRSEESVRDRIKRYLSKLGAQDESRIADAAKKTPNHHIHFVNDKQGHPFKTIGSITENDPSFNFKSGNKKEEKKPKSPAKVILTIF